VEEEAEIRHHLNQGTGQAIHQETVRLSKDGKRIDVALTLSPVRDASGAIVASSMVCRDITQRKADDQQLKLLHNTLEQRVNERTLQLDRANKELQSFSYSVSHDLRAPLRGIDGWSSALMEDFGEKLGETGLEYLGRVRSETQRMGQLIDDLLRMAMISQSGIVVKEVDISKCVRSTADRLRETSPDRIVDFIIEPALVVQGDAGLLDVALTNLIENAWKYTSKLPAARIEFGVMKVGEEVAYFVRDNGDGFDMKYASKLFAPFHRMHTPRDFPGTGVGLATVQRIIHRHSGRIWAEAKPKFGATFFFTLGKPESIR